MSKPRNTPIVIFCLLLAAVTLAFYNPLVHNQFTGFDDWSYILKNPNITAGLNWNTMKWSFTTFREGNWHPLTWLSHALDYQLFRLNPIGHHYTNLLIHVANAVLLFLLLRRATGSLWPSLIVAALFALHPINVESVAWAAERKNVLSTLFFLLALHAYDRFARRSQSDPNRVYLYFAVSLCFVLGLLAKPQIVTLPFVLLLWDYWPLHRVATAYSSEDVSLAPPPQQSLPVPRRSLLREKLPLFILAAADSVMTVFAQRAGNAVRTISEVPLAQRMSNIPISYVRYIEKLFWPVHLAPLYPRSVNAVPIWQVIVATAFLLLVSAWVWRWRSRRYLVFGWLWFLGTLVPMIGIVTVGEQSMADRYAYIPFIGLFIAIVWGMKELTEKQRVPILWRSVPVLAVLLVFAILTHRQIGYWHDDETLWRYTLRVTHGNYVAHNNLAVIYAEAGKSEEAIVEFQAAASLHRYPPGQVLALAFYELKNGHPQEAIEQCASVLQASSDPKVQAIAWSEKGQGHLQLRDFKQAWESFQNALRISPDNALALVGSGVLELREGRSDLAVTRLVRAVNSDPSAVNFLLLSQALRHVGRPAEANNALAQARKISPDLSVAQNTAGQFLAVAGITPI
jgi:tetratricopeptide (TPR) repeat protein